MVIIYDVAATKIQPHQKRKEKRQKKKDFEILQTISLNIINKKIYIYIKNT